jgi:hypothetical protein
MNNTKLNITKQINNKSLTVSSDNQNAIASVGNMSKNNTGQSNQVTGAATGLLGINTEWWWLAGLLMCVAVAYALIMIRHKKIKAHHRINKR